jgi:oxygen-independent coproporphyrinogen III oxidase
MAGIYVHIPFCKKFCHYCDFYHVILPGENSSFINALLEEIRLKQNYIEGETISTIYIGGGTPSVFSAGELGIILDNLYDIFKIEEKSEITIELNPDDVSSEYLKSLKRMNINRLSIGIQSWIDPHLKMLNRRHDSIQAKRALDDAFNEGFENVSIDLIYGIPGMKTDEWSYNLDHSFSFDIRHLSAYHLTFEPGTVFGERLRKGLISEIDEDDSAAMFNMLIDKAERAGYIHYEISNFGKPGFFSIHNSNYWKQVNYIGLGPSAHSFNGYSRQWNVRDLKKYISYVMSGRQYFEREELDMKARFNEYIMTSMRTMWGIDLEYIEKTFEKEGFDYVVNLASKLREYGLIRQTGNSLILTNQGKMISDNIITEFIIPGGD